MSKTISVSVESSSLKFRLSKIPSEEVLTSGIVEGIEFEDVILTIKASGEKIKKVLPIPDHVKAINMLLEASVEYKIVDSLDEIIGAGYCTVYGGEIFKENVPVTEDVVEKFASLNDLVPLHNPAGLVGCNTFENSLPNCRHVFAFDTAFHLTMPKEPCVHALPVKYYDEYKIHHYDFHGTSHKYVSLRCAELTDKKVEDTKVIMCHLRNRASITVADGGRFISTFVGFTPFVGIMMGTRRDDIDPATVTCIMKRASAIPDEMDDVMNTQPGMLGISGISPDARDVEDGCKEENPITLLITKVCVSRVINTVGGYYAQPGGADVIVFTGGIGENDINIRKMICDRLSVAFGIQLNEELSGKTRGEEILLSTAESRVTIWLIPTNEEPMIARGIYCLITQL